MADLDLTPFCCQNQDCPRFGERGQGNVYLRAVYGKNKDRPLLKCRDCGKTFSAYRGTVFYNSKLPQEKVVDVLQHAREGCGVRGTARLTHVCQNTVIRYSRLAGQHARQAHDELVGFSPLDRQTSAR